MMQNICKKFLLVLMFVLLRVDALSMKENFDFDKDNYSEIKSPYRIKNFITNTIQNNGEINKNKDTEYSNDMGDDISTTEEEIFQIVKDKESLDNFEENNKKTLKVLDIFKTLNEELWKKKEKDKAGKKGNILKDINDNKEINLEINVDENEDINTIKKFNNTLNKEIEKDEELKAVKDDHKMRDLKGAINSYYELYKAKSEIEENEQKKIEEIKQLEEKLKEQNDLRIKIQRNENQVEELKRLEVKKQEEEKKGELEKKKKSLEQEYEVLSKEQEVDERKIKEKAREITEIENHIKLLPLREDEKRMFIDLKNKENQIKLDLEASKKKFKEINEMINDSKNEMINDSKKNEETREKEFEEIVGKREANLAKLNIKKKKVINRLEEVEKRIMALSPSDKELNDAIEKIKESKESKEKQRKEELLDASNIYYKLLQEKSEIKKIEEEQEEDIKKKEEIEKHEEEIKTEIEKKEIEIKMQEKILDQKNSNLRKIEEEEKEEEGRTEATANLIQDIFKCSRKQNEIKNENELKNKDENKEDILNRSIIEKESNNEYLVELKNQKKQIEKDFDETKKNFDKISTEKRKILGILQKKIKKKKLYLENIEKRREKLANKKEKVDNELQEVIKRIKTLSQSNEELNTALHNIKKTKEKQEKEEIEEEKKKGQEIVLITKEFEDQVRDIAKNNKGGKYDENEILERELRTNIEVLDNYLKHNCTKHYTDFRIHKIVEKKEKKKEEKKGFGVREYIKRSMDNIEEMIQKTTNDEQIDAAMLEKIKEIKMSGNNFLLSPEIDEENNIKDKNNKEKEKEKNDKEKLLNSLEELKRLYKLNKGNNKNVKVNELYAENMETAQMLIKKEGDILKGKTKDKDQTKDRILTKINKIENFVENLPIEEGSEPSLQNEENSLLNINNEKNDFMEKENLKETINMNEDLKENITYFGKKPLKNSSTSTSDSDNLSLTGFLEGKYYVRIKSILNKGKKQNLNRIKIEKENSLQNIHAENKKSLNVTLTKHDDGGQPIKLKSKDKKKSNKKDAAFFFKKGLNLDERAYKKGYYRYQTLILLDREKELKKNHPHFFKECNNGDSECKLDHVINNTKVENKMENEIAKYKEAVDLLTKQNSEFSSLILLRVLGRFALSFLFSAVNSVMQFERKDVIGPYFSIYTLSFGKITQPSFLRKNIYIDISLSLLSFLMFTAIDYKIQNKYFTYVRDRSLHKFLSLIKYTTNAFNININLFLNKDFYMSFNIMSIFDSLLSWVWIKKTEVKDEIKGTINFFKETIKRIEADDKNNTDESKKEKNEALEKIENNIKKSILPYKELFFPAFKEKADEKKTIEEII